MIQAVRIEAEDGYGLFCTYNNDGEKRPLSTNTLGLVELDIRHNHHFPTASSELYGFTREKHYCAYKTINQLKEWITQDELNTIIAGGFKIYLLHLSEAIEGDFQIAYDKDHILVKEDITQLFKA